MMPKQKLIFDRKGVQKTMLIRIQIARCMIQESGRRNGDNRPASWFHLEVQRFACDEEYVEDAVRCARY